MWWKKETELQKLVTAYERDKDILGLFAGSVKKSRIEDITLEDIKSFYMSVVAPKNSLWERNSYMMAVRKFFRYHRGGNILKATLITDNPLISVEEIVKVEPMKKKVKKETRGRPVNIEFIKKVKFLIDEGGLTIRGVARAEGKDPKTIHSAYHYPKGYKQADLLV